MYSRVKWREEEKIDIGSQVKYDLASRKSVPPQAGEIPTPHVVPKTNALSIYIMILVKKRTSMNCGMQQLYGIGCLLYEMKEIAQNK